MKTFRFLLDENVPHALRNAILQKNPELVIWRVGDPGAPPKGTPDPDILLWCEKYAFILITFNRASIPLHVHHHLSQGNHFPGIFTLHPSMSFNEITNEILLICGAASPEEFRDLIVYLPI